MADARKSSTAVAFIIISEACERFCYYGLRTILALYLTSVLHFDEASATVIFHTFVCMVYFFPIVGAIISDSWLGKYKTIIWMYFLYALGCFFITLASAKSDVVASQIGVSFLGLFLIAVSSGGIKPCVAAFGGDQFELPQQVMELIRFFSQFYFAISVGSMTSTAIVPLLGEKIKCFGDNSCYSLAFGVTGLMMGVALLIFICGSSFYNIVAPEGNMLVKVSGCVGHAIRMRLTNVNVQKAHWLDYASDSYDQDLIEDIKTVFRVLIIFIPLPVFWSLYEQQGSGWTFQARRMNGELGGTYTILPDQMQIANPLIVMVLIIFFEYTLYPFLNKIHFGSSLQRMLCGGILAALAFLVTGYVSTMIESGTVEKPGFGFGQFRIYNTFYCDIKITASKLNGGDPFEIRKLDFWADTQIPVCGIEKTDYTVEGCNDFKDTGEWEIVESASVGYYYVQKKTAQIFDDVERHRLGLPKVRFLVDYHTPSWKERVLNFTGRFHGGEIVCEVDNTSIFALRPDYYLLKMESLVHDDLHLSLGGVYVVIVGVNMSNSWISELRAISKENEIHMLWQLPQYILLSAGEVMFAISGLEFAYSQAPISMKSVMQASFLLTYAIGNIIVIVISYLELYEKQSSNFFFYSGIMIIDMIVFSCLALTYDYVQR